MGALPTLTKHDLVRFWRKVDRPAHDNESDEGSPGPCWLWKGGCSNTGYGSFSVGGKNYAAHRLSFAIEHGAVPASLHVMHSCDTPRCVNPAHLFAGTHARNMRDKREKGRAQRLTGALNGKTMCSADKARRIFLAYRSRRLTQQQIADLFGVSRSKVADIANRRSHRDVTEGL